MLAKRDIAAAAVTVCVVVLVSRREPPSLPQPEARAFLAMAPPELPKGKPDEPKATHEREPEKESKPWPARSEAPLRQDETLEPERAIEAADPPKTNHRQPADQPDHKAKAQKVAKRTSESGMKPIIDLTSNVRCVADVSRIRAGDISRLMGDEAILVAGRSLYRIHRAGAERLSSAPKGRCCMYLRPGLRPAWLVSQLKRACLGAAADVHLILSHAARSELASAVLGKLKKDKNFADTAYEVAVRWEADGSRSKFTVTRVRRKRLKTAARNKAKDGADHSKRKGAHL